MRGGCPVSGHKLRRCWKTQPPAATDTSASPWSVVFVSRGLRDNRFGLVSNWGFVRELRLEELVLDVEIGTVKFGARFFKSGKPLFADSFEGLLSPVRTGVGCSSAAKSRNWWWLV
ncbi:hypothetical protein Droror1_Dr00006385 [Drosera rotundifolia]